MTPYTIKYRLPKDHWRHTDIFSNDIYTIRHICNRLRFIYKYYEFAISSTGIIDRYEADDLDMDKAEMSKIIKNLIENTHDDKIKTALSVCKDYLTLEIPNKIISDYNLRNVYGEYHAP